MINTICGVINKDCTGINWVYAGIDKISAVINKDCTAINELWAVHNK